jgi:hypothetical protein
MTRMSKFSRQHEDPLFLGSIVLQIQRGGM